VLLILPYFEGAALAIVRALPVAPRIHEILSALVSRFLFGLRAIRSPPRAALFYGLTAIIWSNDAIALMICAQALGPSLGFSAALLTLSALGLSSSAPSTPGFIGIYQFVAVTVLPLFGFRQVDALAFILALQGVIYVYIIPWGLIGLWRLSVTAPRET
jgi:uncharacterized membrane protein YbhN (UPF0104 family)